MAERAVGPMVQLVEAKRGLAALEGEEVFDIGRLLSAWAVYPVSDPGYGPFVQSTDLRNSRSQR